MYVRMYVATVFVSSMPNSLNRKRGNGQHIVVFTTMSTCCDSHDITVANDTIVA